MTIFIHITPPQELDDLWEWWVAKDGTGVASGRALNETAAKTQAEAHAKFETEKREPYKYEYIPET